MRWGWPVDLQIRVIEGGYTLVTPFEGYTFFKVFKKLQLLKSYTYVVTLWLHLRVTL